MMISDAQVAAMSSKILDQFGRDICHRLAEALPDWEQAASEDQRERQVAGILRYGRQLQLSDADDLYHFTWAILRFGLGVPIPHGFVAEFRQTGISPAARVENLLLRLISGRDAKTPVML